MATWTRWKAEAMEAATDRRRLTYWSLALAVSLVFLSLGSAPAWAEDDPEAEDDDESDEDRSDRPGKPDTSDSSDGAEPSDAPPSRKAKRRPKKEILPVRTEKGIFPAVAYDSDLGVGFGLVTNFARINPDFDPYRWRLGVQAFLYLRPRPEGGIEVPYQSHYVRFDKPGLAGGRLRMRAELWFRKHSNAGYYGLGNQSAKSEPWTSIDRDEQPEAWARSSRFQEYDRIYPRLSGELRLTLPAELFAFGSLGLSWNWLTVYDGSRLAQDLAADPGSWVAETLVGTRRHGLLETVVGLAWDTRNDETAPSSGMFHEVSVRGGPLFEIEGGFVGLNATFRFYLPLFRDWLSVAARVLVDGLFGSPPFYELARFGGTHAADGPGGAMSLRGVPSRRYHGKGKVISNLELRSKFLRVRFAGQHASVGALLFLDTGRVWADLESRPELDGTTLGIHTGLGGGLRLQVGETFVVRIDAGWSPGEFGLYFDVDHIF